LCEQIDYNLLFRWFVGLGLAHHQEICSDRLALVLISRGPAVENSAARNIG